MLIYCFVFALFVTQIRADSVTTFEGYGAPIQATNFTTIATTKLFYQLDDNKDDLLSTTTYNGTFALTQKDAVWTTDMTAAQQSCVKYQDSQNDNQYLCIQQYIQKCDAGKSATLKLLVQLENNPPWEQQSQENVE